MEELLEEAIARLQQIDPVDQRYWAWRILEGLEEDRKWDEMIASPDGQRVLERMADEALADIGAGRVGPLTDADFAVELD